MSHTKGIAQAHEIGAEGEEMTYKALAHVPAGEGTRSLRVFGELVTCKIPSQRTGGAYSLFEVATPPESGPPPHVHHREDEAFYVLEGDYEFLIDGRTSKAGAGSLLYVQKGSLHAHRNVGGSVGRMLTIQTPGGLFEGFFEAAGEATGGGAKTLAFEDERAAPRTRAIAASYGIEIPPPRARRFD